MSVITNKVGKLEYLTAEGISVPHCFTTRHGGVSTGSQSSLNLAGIISDGMQIVILSKEEAEAVRLEEANVFRFHFFQHGC